MVRGRISHVESDDCYDPHSDAYAGGFGLPDYVQEEINAFHDEVEALRASEELAEESEPPASGAGLKFPGFLKIPSEALASLISAVESGDPLPLRPGENREDVWQEASAELLRRAGVGETAVA